MSKIAVIKTGGKQYVVKEGDKIKIEKINDEPDKIYKFETLLVASADEKELMIGQPTLGEKVSGKILAHGRADKVLVTKYKRKTRYLRNVGHRQPFTKIEITKIE